MSHDVECRDARERLEVNGEDAPQAVGTKAVEQAPAMARIAGGVAAGIGGAGGDGIAQRDRAQAGRVERALAARAVVDRARRCPPCGGR